MHEVDWRLKSISSRKTNDSHFAAALHGVKLKGGNNQVECKLSQEQDKKLTDALKARMQKDAN